MTELRIVEVKGIILGARYRETVDTAGGNPPPPPPPPVTPTRLALATTGVVETTGIVAATVRGVLFLAGGALKVL